MCVVVALGSHTGHSRQTCDKHGVCEECVSFGNTAAVFVCVCVCVCVCVYCVMHYVCVYVYVCVHCVMHYVCVYYIILCYLLCVMV